MAESYTGTEGQAALAAGYPILDGTEDRREGYLAVNKTRDMIATGTLHPDDAAPVGAVEGGKLVRYKANTRVPVSSPIAAADAANKAYVDAQIAALSARIAKLGG